MGCLDHKNQCPRHWLGEDWGLSFTDARQVGKISGAASQCSLLAQAPGGIASTMRTFPPASTNIGFCDLQAGENRLRIEQFSESIFRVRMTRRDSFLAPQSLMVVRSPMTEPTWSVEESARSVTLRTRDLWLSIDRKTLALAWFDGKGEPLVREPERDGKQLTDFPVERSVFPKQTEVVEERTADGVKSRADAAQKVWVRDAYSTKTQFVFSEGEAIYGLGQHEEGILNYRGRSQYLYQQNMKVAMPAIVSTRGYGVLWDTSSLASFHDDESGSYFWTEADDELDYYFVAGPEFSQIVKGFRELTGKPTMLPRWAYGYIQSKERYKTQDELIAVVAEHRRRRIPLDCIVLDWQSWSGEDWGQKSLDPGRFPDPEAMTAKLHAMDAQAYGVDLANDAERMPRPAGDAGTGSSSSAIVSPTTLSIPDARALILEPSEPGALPEGRRRMVVRLHGAVSSPTGTARSSPNPTGESSSTPRRRRSISIRDGSPPIPCFTPKASTRGSAPPRATRGWST